MAKARKCQICKKEPGNKVEVEIFLDTDNQFIVQAYVCPPCVDLLRKFCSHGDISADSREGFEELFFNTTMVRVWFKGGPNA